jgi:hypothetical protein
MISYNSVSEEIENIIDIIYRRHFRFRDYMKEARLHIWKYMNYVDGINREDFLQKVPLEAKHAMMQYLNKIYHLRTDSGYLECSDVDGVILSNVRYFDDSLNVLLLLYDVRLIIKKILKKVWDKEKYYKLSVLLLMGYSHEEIGEYLGWHKNNVYARKMILGKSLMQGLRYV